MPRLIRVQLSVKRSWFEIEIEDHADKDYIERAVEATAGPLIKAEWVEVPHTPMPSRIDYRKVVEAEKVMEDANGQD